MRILLFISMFCFLSSCAQLENTTGRMLENSHDAFRAGEPKIWMPREGEEEKQEKNADDAGWEKGYSETEPPQQKGDFEHEPPREKFY